MRRPLFPGKTEGRMIIEQVAILGLPSVQELKGMSKQITEAKIELVQRLDNIQKTDFTKVIQSEHYAQKDIELAAKLLDKMLMWVPSQRISCLEALNDPFFK